MPPKNKATITKRNVNVAAGIDKHLQTPLILAGKTYTPADLKAVFTRHTAAVDAADALKKQWTDQLLVADQASAEASDTYARLRNALRSQYGADANAVLNDFGMEMPKAPGPKTLKTKTIAADRREGTRKARHTMGKIQKKEVTWATVAPASSTSPAPTPSGASTTNGTAPQPPVVTPAPSVPHAR